MTILEYMWHVAKYSVFGVKLNIDNFSDPVEIVGVNIRTLEFETSQGFKIIPTGFTKIQMYLYPIDHLSGDDLIRYQAWSNFLQKDTESQEKFLKRLNNIEYLLCSRYIDYLGLIPKGFAIDATGKDIYGNME